jgi:transcriptional regulator with XRE-family HTH domain
MLNLKIMRIRHRLTLQQLAEKTGLHYNTISQYENGVHLPRKDNLEKIAVVFGCEVDDLMDERNKNGKRKSKQ